MRRLARKLSNILSLILTGFLVCALAIGLFRRLIWRPEETFYSPTPKPSPTPVAAALSNPPLDINTATAESLTALPGIGPKTALAILQTRAAIGGFLYKEELLQVPGIGEKKLAAIYDLITLSPLPGGGESGAQEDDAGSAPENDTGSAPENEAGN